MAYTHETRKVESTRSNPAASPAAPAPRLTGAAGTRASGQATATAEPSPPADRARVEQADRAKASNPINFESWSGDKPGAGTRQEMPELQLRQGQILRRGDINDEVRQVQRMLQQHGFSLKDDGENGPETQRALRAFQVRHKLRVDGIVGPETSGKLNELRNGAAPAPPAKPDDVSVAGRQGGLGEQTALPPGGRPLNLGRLATLQSAQRNQDGSFSFTAGATIDVDGSGPKYGDPHAQNQTSLNLRGRPRYPNADKVPYFVLPPHVARQMGARVGDLGMITYRGRTIAAIFADQGPSNRIGELSRNAALQLGIPASPISGGTNSGVSYRVFPGSRGSRPPSAAEITPEALTARLNQLLQR